VIFIIGIDGQIEVVNVRDTELNNGTVERCLCNVISKLTFPTPRGRGRVVVEFPFDFYLIYPGYDEAEQSSEQDGSATGKVETEADTEDLQLTGDEEDSSSGGEEADGKPDANLGALSKSEIDQVIKSNLTPIRWCYQQQLNLRPKLHGKVVVRFTIGADGSVIASGIRSTSMHNDWVERCVCMKIARLKFPPPKGGGIVHVNYPFVFKSD